MQAKIHMDERTRIVDASQQLAAAIGRRDLAAIQALLAPDFVHRTHGGPAVDIEAFLRAIQDLPGEIAFVRLDRLQVDLTTSGALVTGIQHAQVHVDGQTIDDRRRFVDWFVNFTGEWRIQAAVDLPEQETE
jgi:ketosteroid isomerase-like protein